jgi:ATP-dependent DNA helicase RecG
MLQNLVSLNFLASTGGRGAVYHLPGEALPRPEDVFGVPVQFGVSSPDLGASSPDLESSSPDLGSRDANGCLLSPLLNLPIIDNLEGLASHFRNSLEEIARLPREKKKVSRDVLISVVLELCEGYFITLRCLSKLVDRQPKSLRESYLSGMVRERKLSLAFPMTPTHEKQAYCTSSSLPESETECEVEK